MSSNPPRTSSSSSAPKGRPKASAGAPSTAPSNPRLNQDVLKIVHFPAPNEREEYNLSDSLVTIGRLKTSVIHLVDPLVSGAHAQILNGFLVDNGSTNGTLLNGKPVKKGDKKLLLKAGDVIKVGDVEMRVERGAAQRGAQELNRSKRFLGSEEVKGEQSDDAAKNGGGESPLTEEESKIGVEELMEQEFKRIIGHEKIKTQLRQFHKKVQLDRIRQQNGKDLDQKRLYHMIFSGPPGTGKTTMANVVAKIMLKMRLVQTDKVVFVNNSLELIGSYVGQTPAKVDAKVEEAKGGVIFIDEAYSIVKDGGGREGSSGSFGREAIDTIMKHLDPPSCVFIFAGYEKPMNEFLKVNEGLARRIPYRYQFEPYTIGQLLEIFHVMCEAKGESLEEGLGQQVAALLDQLPQALIDSQNAGLIANWVSFAQMERDDRISIEEAERNPAIASLLTLADFTSAIDKLKEMKSGNDHES